MPAITDQQISLLCDVSQSSLLTLDPEKKRDLDQLIMDGFVKLTVDDLPIRYKLTAKDENVLGERGAGLNES